MISRQEWLRLNSREVAQIVETRISTAVVYSNGTRRWFLTQSQNWDDYTKITSQALRKLCQLFYDQGIHTLLQPLLGYDLVERGPDYLTMVVEGLRELAGADFLRWYHKEQIRVTFYGNWVKTLCDHGFPHIAEALQFVVNETAYYTNHKLLFGLFADEGLDNIVTMAKHVDSGTGLLTRYYGQFVEPVDLVIGSGQPVIWDVPLLDINKANLYFLQAPTFCLDKITLRNILYDSLYERVNDDVLYENVSASLWQRLPVLGLGQRGQQGWIAA